MDSSYPRSAKVTKLLTIPVNNIETIPDRPRPSANMYLKSI